MCQLAGCAGGDRTAVEKSLSDNPPKITDFTYALGDDDESAVKPLGKGQFIQFKIEPCLGSCDISQTYWARKYNIPINYVGREDRALNVHTVLRKGEENVEYTITSAEADVLTTKFPQLIKSFYELKDGEYLVIDNGPGQRFLVGMKKIPIDLPVVVPVNEQGGKYELFQEQGNAPIIFAHAHLSSGTEFKTVKEDRFALTPEYMAELGKKWVFLRNTGSTAGAVIAKGQATGGLKATSDSPTVTATGPTGTSKATADSPTGTSKVTATGGSKVTTDTPTGSLKATADTPKTTADTAKASPKVTAATPKTVAKTTAKTTTDTPKATTKGAPTGTETKTTVKALGTQHEIDEASLGPLGAIMNMFAPSPTETEMHNLAMN